jgi:hypothetical protein
MNKTVLTLCLLAASLLLTGVFHDIGATGTRNAFGFISAMLASLTLICYLDGNKT